MSDRQDEEIAPRATTDLGEDFLQRLARWAAGSFTRLPWPKNILTILCAETLKTRAEIEALKKQCLQLRSDMRDAEARLQTWKRKLGVAP